MEDYKEIIKEMLLTDFSPRPIDTKKALKEALFMTTIEVLQMVQGIIPSKPIDEHDIFDVLKETGFNYGINEENGIYVWFLFKKESNFVI
ncbi:hypothetical protein CAPN004_09030 [Capnocytophaga cynodegmi]|uniref:hypothetical protein n=1 Tax=Capnocytophaga cynodegmi TaxID=28189 RepID=UPI001AC6ACB0|nr:hypothetical protein [Capnocytophaga cynodegmi]GIM51873.1 hypothetical protein CAPN004_09030 [Capnocytophaga cynodegmi]